MRFNHHSVVVVSAVLLIAGCEAGDASAGDPAFDEASVEAALCSGFCPARTPVDYDPTLLAPGKSTVIYYNGWLASGSQVVVYYQYDDLLGPTAIASMTRRADGYWQSSPIPLPTGTKALHFFFNDGNGVNNGAGRFDYSGGWKLAVTPSGGIVPAAPVKLATTVDPRPSIALWWNSEGTLSHTIYRSTAANGPFTVIGSSIGNSFNDTTVAPDTGYIYRVKASNASGDSPVSATVSARTLPANCASSPATFAIANAGTVWGQDVYVVGDQPELGNWNPAQAFRLTIQGSGANATWKGTVTMRSNQYFLYKYIKLNRASGRVVWESDQTFSFATTRRDREGTTAGCGDSRTFDDGSFKR